MILKKFNHILEVAECKSINKAANNLFISHQALSATIKSLEKELNFKIFDRTIKGVELTAKGERIITDVRKIIKITNEWGNYQNIEDEICGDVHIGVTSFASQLVLYEVVSKCKAKYPKVTVVPKLFQRGGYAKDFKDIKILGLLLVSPVVDENNRPKNSFFDNGYAVEKLWVDRMDIFINSDNSLAKNYSVCLSQLKDLDLAMLPNDDKLPAERKLYKSFSKNNPSTYADHFAVFSHILKNKDSVAVFPRFLKKIDYFNTDSVAQLKIEDYCSSYACYLVYPRLDKLTHTEKKVLAILKETTLELGEKLGIELLDNSR